MQQRNHCYMVTSWLVTGATGQVGSHVVAELAKSPENVVVALHSGREDVNDSTIASSLSFACLVRYEAINFETHSSEWSPRITSLMEQFQTDVVVHCAAIANLKVALDNPTLARAVNVTATSVLAELSVQQRCKAFLHCSTDMVFDGNAHLNAGRSSGSFYKEDDPTRSLSSYGKSKVDAENVIRTVATEGIATQFVIARLPLMFGIVHTPRGARGSSGSFIPQLRQLARTDQMCCGFTDEYRTPLSLRSASRLLIEVGKGALRGFDNKENPVVLHFAGKERVSRYSLLLQMQEALQSILINTYTDATCLKLMEALGTTASAPQLEGDCSTCSPTSQLRNMSETVLNARIESASRNSFPSAELRPEDLSLSTEKLDLCIASLGLQNEPVLLLSLADQMSEALALWVQLLSDTTSLSLQQ